MSCPLVVLKRPATFGQTHDHNGHSIYVEGKYGSQTEHVFSRVLSFHVCLKPQAPFQPKWRLITARNSRAYFEELWSDLEL